MELESKKVEWQQTSEEVLSGMIEWRMQHPKATLREIEQEVEKRLARLRTQMVQDTAQASAAREWSQRSQQERPCCEECGTPLVSRGQRTRRLQGRASQPIELKRSYGTCPSCGGGFFPPG
jgi:septal ring factor EnvC (AmiA/AmiB activator)